MKYVDLVVSNNTDATDSSYTYSCEFDDVSIGDKVKVPFAKGNRELSAYVLNCKDEVLDSSIKYKSVISIDKEESLNPEMVRTALWIKRRYLCRMIEAISCFEPAGSKSKRGKKRNPYLDYEGDTTPMPELNFDQKKVVSALDNAIDKGEHKIFLLHGVTGSGKTEVYMRAIASAIAKGKTAIVLVPEISLTPQLIDRIIGRFGSSEVAVLHSKLSLGQRYDEWQRIKKGEVKIVIGARSAVFAPLENIGIIVVDEEHEASYKSDKSPKYDGIEVAIKRAMDKDNNAIVILGSATPSTVSFERAKEGIYEKLELPNRYNMVPLPEYEIADMREELKNGNKSIFSRSLYEKMEVCLKEGKQVILFLNRRGYSSFVSCRNCGYVMKCTECGISLTYHKSKSKAVCHYCGRAFDIPKVCPECGSKYIKHFGIGTEKLEEEVASLFPEYAVSRLDLDTASIKGASEKILKDFKKGKTKILVGTQLVAKGLDFNNVGVVGIVSADVSLNIPDYRSAERTFQLITQAAGRAGRGEEKGQVVVQTYNPDHYAILSAAANDYDSFFKTEIMLRESLKYPPFSDFIELLFLSEKEEDTKYFANYACAEIKRLLNDEAYNCFEPQQAYIAHEAGKYRYTLLLKCPKGRRKEYLEILAKVKQEIVLSKRARCSVIIDINPY